MQRVASEPDPHWPDPTQLVLLGHPVAHSLSPRFQQAALDAAGRPVRYLAHDVPPASLTEVLQTLRTTRAAGNVTVPHKEAVFAACDACTPIAGRVGAVNTFRHDVTGRLIGHNTDVAGVQAALTALLGDCAPRPSRVVLLGAGGSARAVLVALSAWGNTQIAIAARTPHRAEQLAAQLDVSVTVLPHDAITPSHALRDALASAALVVNTTPIGLRDAQQPVPSAWLGAHTSALDLVYRTGETAWVHACRARGLTAQDGLRMLVEQGAAAYAWWFGEAPDREAMWRVLESRPGTRVTV
jgi:shikimate dehydrogenase